MQGSETILRILMTRTKLLKLCHIIHLCGDGGGGGGSGDKNNCYLFEFKCDYILHKHIK